MSANNETPGTLSEQELAQHALGIRRYLSGMLRPDELADATQTVLQRALENLPRYRGDSSPRVWLLGIARNVGFEIARARQRELARTWPRNTRPGESDDLITADLFAADQPTQEDQLGRKEQQALTFAALDDMSLDDKLALLITYVDNVPGPEAAEILGVSFPAFRQRLSRARQALAVRLEALLAKGQPGDAAVLEQWRALLNPEPQSGDDI